MSFEKRDVCFCSTVPSSPSYRGSRVPDGSIGSISIDVSTDNRPGKKHEIKLKQFPRVESDVVRHARGRATIFEHAVVMKAVKVSVHY